jgi:enoyl-CoA hydratase
MSTYQLDNGFAHITLDEGKVNALGSASLSWLNEQLDRALADDASAVILAGRLGMFSAGFDLKEIRSGPTQQAHLRRALIDLELRIFEFGRPVVIACTGHALAAGAALLLAADRRIGCPGSFKIGFNEAAMGVPISGATVELARYRMPMPWFESLVVGETFSPEQAQFAGLLDEVAEDEGQVLATAQRAAGSLAEVSLETFVTMRHSARGATAERIRTERSRL